MNHPEEQDFQGQPGLRRPVSNPLPWGRCAQEVVQVYGRGAPRTRAIRSSHSVSAAAARCRASGCSPATKRCRA